MNLKDFINKRTKQIQYGNRPDGTPKGAGFLGELIRPDGRSMTEYSIGVEFDDYKGEIPTLVPTLTKDEINQLLNIQEGENIPKKIEQKAINHARMRRKKGLSVFAD